MLNNFPGTMSRDKSGAEEEEEGRNTDSHGVDDKRYFLARAKATLLPPD